MVANGFASWSVWISFSIFLVIALSIDAKVMHSEKFSPHASAKKALYWTFFWIASALIFNLLLWLFLLETNPTIANQKALNFLTGYIIEKSLSIDNLFVFYLVFSQFHIPPKYQQRVFSYGIWGAVIMRLGLILAGSYLVNRFHWLLYLMGVFLVFTGIKMMFMKKDEENLKSNRIYNFLTRSFRITHEFSGESFFIRKNNLWYATPLFIAVIFIEISDIIFAFDSIPAIFAITTDPFIVWTSNIFAILGLRALYFCLSAAVQRLRFLKYGIALILIFIGGKMVVEPWLALSVSFSLFVIVSILLLFTFISITAKSKR